MTTPKTEIYFATRKTASAHVYITKGKGKVRINNVPVEMIPQETAREVILVPLEITGDLRDKIDISVILKERDAEECAQDITKVVENINVALNPGEGLILSVW